MTSALSTSIRAGRAGLVIGAYPGCRLILGLKWQVGTTCTPRRRGALGRSCEKIVDLSVSKNLFKLIGHRNPEFLLQDMGAEFVSYIFDIGHNRFGPSETFDDDPSGANVNQPRDFAFLESESLILELGTATVSSNRWDATKIGLGSWLLGVLGSQFTEVFFGR